MELAQVPFELRVAQNKYPSIINVVDKKNGPFSDPINLKLQSLYAIHICNKSEPTPSFYISTNNTTSERGWIDNVDYENPQTAVVSGLLFINTADFILGKRLYIRSPDYYEPIAHFEISGKEDKVLGTYDSKSVTVYVG
jgi:hypothetical protein